MGTLGAVVVAAVELSGLGACGDNATNDAPLPPVQNVVARVDVASTSECPFGGSVVKSGVDRNGNGALEDLEIENRTPLCNATPVQPAPAIVLRLIAEPIGEHCAFGGTAVSSGPDRNSNGVLDDDEVTKIDYVCGEALLTRLREQGPGAACIAGGVVFQVGRDRDGDGALGDDEVEQSDVQCGTELARDVVIASSADAAALGKITAIAGSLTLDASGVDELVLPALAVVRGGLEIRHEPALTHLALPALESVGGRFVLSENTQLVNVDLPALTRVAGLQIDSNPVLPDLRGMASLGDVAGDLQITHNASLTAADLPYHGGFNSVTIDDNARLGQVALSIPERLGPLHIAGNAALTKVVIERTPGRPMFGMALDTIVIDDNARLAEVSIAGDSTRTIAIDRNPMLASTTVSTFVIHGDLSLRDNGPASLTLGVVTRGSQVFLDTLTLSGPITELHSGNIIASGDCDFDSTQLVSISDSSHIISCDGSAHVTRNALLGQMRLLAAHSLEVRGNAVLANLDGVGGGPGNQLTGDLIVADNPVLLSAPTLESFTQIAGDVTITGNPKLSSAFGFGPIRIGGAVVVEDNDELRELGFLQLRGVRSLAISRCAALTHLDFPALAEVASRIDVRDNAALQELALPKLHRADVSVVDNPHLPACAVEALFAGLTGEHDQSGNDDAAECAP